MGVQEPLSNSSRQFGTPATVMVRPLLLKPQWMNGLSERLLVSHYENDYGGALRRLNTIRARLAALDWPRVPGFEINGLKREELIAAGSVILHETYFDSLGGHGDSPPNGPKRLHEPLRELDERQLVNTAPRDTLRATEVVMIRGVEPESSFVEYN